MQSVNLKIDGMGCGACVRKVAAALNSVPGTRVEDVTVGSATCLIDRQAASADQLVEAVTAAGYSATETH